MWKTLVLGGLTATILFVGVSRSDVGGDPDALSTDPSFPLPAPSPDPVAPAPPGAQPARDPFTPYDVGPPAATWRYEDLAPAEMETADLGRDVSGWSASQDAMVAAVREQGRIEAAKIAQRQLGLGQLGDTGVVP